MKEFIEYQITTNRYVYNRLRKNRLEKTGKIRCSWCSYNSGENSTKKWYGSKFNCQNLEAEMDELLEDVRHPSWKLTSKNSKQWQRKEVLFVEKSRQTWKRGSYRKQSYVEIVF